MRSLTALEPSLCCTESPERPAPHSMTQCTVLTGEGENGGNRDARRGGGKREEGVERKKIEQEEKRVKGGME